jgi:hypothetical protein
VALPDGGPLYFHHFTGRCRGRRSHAAVLPTRPVGITGVRMGYEGHTRPFPHLPDCRRRPHPAQYRAASEPRDILGSGWDPMKVEVRRESGEHNHRSLVCCTCGGGPVVRLPIAMSISGRVSAEIAY